MKKGLSFLLICMLLVSALLSLFPLGAAGGKIFLSQLAPVSVTTGWAEVHYNENLEGGALALANAGDRRVFANGICIHAESSISFDISGFDVSYFYAVIGMDDGDYGYKSYAGATFEVWADGVKLRDYGTLRLDDAAVEVFVPLPAGTRILTLKNGHGNDGSTWSEHCDWCDACVMSDPNALDALTLRASSAVLAPGQTGRLTFDAYTAGGDPLPADELDVSFFSSDTAVVTVDRDGVYTAVGEGIAALTAQVSAGGKTVEAQSEITVVGDLSQDKFLVSSPSGDLRVLVEIVEGQLFYSVSKRGVTALERSFLGLETVECALTDGFSFVSKTARREIDDVYETYSGAFSSGRDHCTEQALTFACDEYLYTVTVRAYDDGYGVRATVARADGGDDLLTVTDDKTAAALPAGTLLWGSQIGKPDILKGNSYETGYPTVRIENTAGKYILKAPVARVAEDLWVLLSEADLYSAPYIGSIFKGIGHNTLEYTAGPQKTTEDGVTTHALLDGASDGELDRRLAEIERVDIALSPSFTFPWRCAVVGELHEIVENTLFDNLNPPAEGDFSWVEPGYTAWMWLSEGFSGQRNEQTIREYIDLASSLGWKYLILDEGWQPNASVPGKAYDGYFPWFDDLLSYAADKGVGFISWVKLCDLDTPGEREILAEWAEKGIKGIKFDFVESEGVDRIEAVSAIYKKCAECRLLVNEHGGNIPTGERRTYPNVINRESVKGQEYGGVWCSDTTVMPFTRSATGPTDVTPKLEATGSNTAAHQLALNIVLESGIPCMASDTTVYEASNARYILSHLPVAWDETKFLDGYPGDSAVIARRQQGNWYVGGITLKAKNLSFALDFLEEGKTYTALLYKDGASRGEIAVSHFEAVKGETLTVPALDGGGFSLMLLSAGAYVSAAALTPGADVAVLAPGQSERTEWTVSPAGADLSELVFSSSDPSVARVSSSGVVTGISEGVARITATLPSSGVRAEAEVRVSGSRPVCITRGGTVRIVPDVLRAEDTYADLVWSSGDGAVVTVQPDGLVSAVSPGRTFVSVRNAKTGSDEEIEVRVTSIADEGYGEFVIVNPQKNKMPQNSEQTPYTLTMSTLTGDINGQPKNLVLTGAPAENFTLTVRVSGGLNRDFQSIGLVVYHRESSMVTMERRSHSYFGGNVFCASTSISGAYTENRKSDTFSASDAYLKLEKNGSVFRGYFSADGKTWTAVDPITNSEVGSADRLQIGLIARTGTPVAETTATYTDFTVNGRRIPFVARREIVRLYAPDSMTVRAGEPPVLPETLDAYYNDGSLAPVPVTWDLSDYDGDPGVCVLTASTADGASAAVTVTVVLRGDLNGDGKADIGDVTALLDLLASAAAPDDAEADLNGDGKVSIEDVTALLDLLAGG